ncbi:MAG: tRNA uridine-5-carboxymethylaminomethyl(34) synthesis enzyme MnmG [Candidatus Omnitrophica bacterium]|nr:tRNA uridine-5-carboxymethylaminomethyl(34) synthesis enzyme MnmG [Candidatus Omnitrophota bacterium]MCM8826360.1 tRNA uridine-5-carboxymethylaminomethyl(34) synthesis enzyme MnmG [Candidatus Omnitrophota bacterium]
MNYDVIVIGGGHSGIEASWSSAKMGCAVLLITIDINGIGKISCNPAVGGVAKGNLVREVDALGGIIGKITDRCVISFRILNRSKGKAVWATRAQVDRFLYPNMARSILEKNENIRIFQAKVKKILVKSKKVIGVETNFGEVFYGKTVIVCAGTFLKSTIHIGLTSFPGGRLYEESSDELFDSINELGFVTKHFKTGTCARLDKRTIDFSKTIEQPPELDTKPFSFSTTQPIKEQMSCFITYTNSKTHKVILKNLNRSPLYTGKIKSKGVRYCPSLEDKVVKFSDKERHQIFLEPEGRDSVEIYPNGISTSLPFHVQEEFIHTIEGLENARILRPGYGIEHGLIDTRELYPTLESKLIEGLYFAGQVNGTTGYEEAAAQGIVAGINAGLKVHRKAPFILTRHNSYIGVLIDDLTTKGTDEPYRMFTSRCEFRVSLRESNADIRLAHMGFKYGLISKDEYQLILEKKEKIDTQIKKLKSTKVLFEGKRLSLFDILKRPKIDYKDIEPYLNDGNLNSSYPHIEDIKREVEIEIKYEGFMRREMAFLREIDNFDRIKIPPKLDFSKVPSLSKEVVEKLNKFRPVTLGEAIRISGITPAAILNIYNFIKKN